MNRKTLVVVGLGYVGLPLAQAASKAQFDVIGLDLNEQVVRGLNSGNSHIDDLHDSDIKKMIDLGFRATNDATCINSADIVVICVPTPLADDGGPDLGAVLGSARSIASNLSRNTLVVLESTTFPGTTEGLVLPILQESGLKLDEDFWLAFSPERIDPGNKHYSIVNTPKIVGGVTPDSSMKAYDFYCEFIESVITAKGAQEAELAKLIENTYRHINIALVNELAEFCNLLEIDLWNAIDCAASKPFGFQAFYPGPGVGGHCIPIDPNYLSHHIKKVLGRPFRFVELAQEINSGMPTYVYSRVQDILNTQQKAVNGSKVLLIGVTYKPNIADQRESPVIPLAQLLLKNGADISYYDPLVEVWNVQGHEFETPSISLESSKSLQNACAMADVVVVLQPHEAIDLEVVVANAQTILDTRGVLEDDNVVRM